MCFCYFYRIPAALVPGVPAKTRLASRFCNKGFQPPFYLWSVFRRSHTRKHTSLRPTAHRLRCLYRWAKGTSLRPTAQCHRKNIGNVVQTDEVVGNNGEQGVSQRWRAAWPVLPLRCVLQSSLCDACFSPSFAMRASVLPLRCVLQPSLWETCFSPPFEGRASAVCAPHMVLCKKITFNKVQCRNSPCVW